MIATTIEQDCHSVLAYLKRRGHSNTLDLLRVCKLSGRRWAIVRERLLNAGMIEKRTGEGRIVIWYLQKNKL